MVNLKTRRAAVAAATAEHIHFEILLEFAQIGNVWAHCIPKAGDVLFEWLFSGNRCRVTPHVMLRSCSILICFCRGEPQGPRNLLEIKSVTKNAKSCAEAEKIDWLVSFRLLCGRIPYTFERPAQFGASSSAGLFLCHV